MKRIKKRIFGICVFAFMISCMLVVYGQESIISINTYENNLGFIYFDYNPIIYATATNNEPEEKVITIIANAVDENENLVWNNSYDVTVPGYGVVVVPIHTNISRFGIYDLNLSVEGMVVNQQFSICNRPRDGSVSNWCMVNDHTIKGHGIKEISRKIEVLYKAGFGGIRQEYLWEGFEPAVDSFSVPTEATDMIELMDMFGMDILGIMMGCPKYISEWNNGTLPITEETLKEWSKYVEFTANKTKDVSTYYEVWNEYNMRDGADPDNYIKLLQASYEQLHKNPNAIVCGFAAANIGDRQTEYEHSVLEWIDEVLKRGGGEYMDAVSIHCYTNSAPEDDLSTLSTGKTWLIDETRSLLDKYGYEDMPIVVSEMGWSTGSTTHTEIKKAQYMIRYSAMNYGKIDRLYWYVSQDKQNYNENGNLDLYENGLGIINTWNTDTGCENPYGAKPAFLALSNFNAMMNAASALEKSETVEGVYQYKFMDKHNDTLYIAWTTKPEGTEIEILSNEKHVTVYDLYGNIINCDTSGGVVKVWLDESPVYIKLAEKVNNPSEYYPEVLVDYNTRQVTIKGTIADAAESAAISLVKKGVENVGRSDIAYVGQSKMGLNGGYNFDFLLKDISGLYTANIGFDGADKTQTIDLEFDVSIPKLNVLSKNSTIKNMSQLENGDELCVTLEDVSGLIDDTETMLVAAIYKKSNLEEVKTTKLDLNGRTSELKFVIENVDDVDRIKIFVWKQLNVQPLMGVYEID